MHRLCVMTTDLCVTLPETSGSLQSVGSPEHALHRPSNRLALKRKSTKRVMGTTGFPFKLKRVFPCGLFPLVRGEIFGTRVSGVCLWHGVVTSSGWRGTGAEHGGGEG